jgi:hypothetical protein
MTVMNRTSVRFQNAISAAARWVALASLLASPITLTEASAAERQQPRADMRAQLQPQRNLCARLLPSETIAFSGLYPAIEGRLPLSSFAPGQIVEIDPRKTPDEEVKAYITGLQGIGARVSIYLVGGHCDIGDDCDSLPSTVQLGPTGSWNWDKTERRILSITHPAVLDRLAKEIENGWRLGANYIRIDNLHHPTGSTHPRTPAQMKTIIDLGHDIEDRLRADGTIAPDRVTGMVAHNNLVAWMQLIEQGRLRRPPVFLTSERTAQLAAFPGYEGDARMKKGELNPRDVPDIQAGRHLAEHFQVPYSIVEFRRSHDLANAEQTYELPQSYIDTVRRLSGVSEVIVIPNESRYVGREEVFAGRGPRTLPSKPDLSAALGRNACTLAE